MLQEPNFSALFYSLYLPIPKYYVTECWVGVAQTRARSCPHVPKLCLAGRHSVLHQGLVSALTPVPFTFADRGTSACSASRGHPEPAAEFLPQLQGEEIILLGLCSWPGWSPPPPPWARQRVMLLGARVSLNPGDGQGMENASS